jgi:hypothetical protein
MRTLTVRQWVCAEAFVPSVVGYALRNKIKRCIAMVINQSVHVKRYFVGSKFTAVGTRRAGLIHGGPYASWQRGLPSPLPYPRTFLSSLPALPLLSSPSINNV